MFPILVPPKSRRGARVCLPVLVQDVAKAIEAMHTVLGMAHFTSMHISSINQLTPLFSKLVVIGKHPR